MHRPTSASGPKSYDRDLSDVLALQSGVAQAIADKVAVALSSARNVLDSLLRARYRLEVYESYLKGRYVALDTEADVPRGASRTLKRPLRRTRHSLRPTSAWPTRTSNSARRRAGFLRGRCDSKAGQRCTQGAGTGSNAS